MPSSPSRLNIQRNVAIDTPFNSVKDYPNPWGVLRVQASVSGRETEDAAIARMVYGDLIPATSAIIYQNGQLVDIRHMLMCSRCGLWKYDREFERDRTRKIRRGRGYYCKQCKAKSRIFGAPLMDDATVAKLTKGSKRRKRA